MLTVPATQLRETHELLEARQVGEEGRHILEVTVIQAGKSKHGHTYLQEALSAAAPLFEGVRAFADHPRPGDLPERSVRDLVGYYRNARYDSGRVRAELHLVPGNDWLFNLLKESHTAPGLCGLSIDAWGHRENGNITRIDRVDSVDIVTRPAAGGGVDRIIASDRHKENSVTSATDEQTGDKKPQGRLEEATPGKPSGEAAHLREVLRAEREKLEKERKKLREELEQQRRLAESEALLSSTLRESGLPAPVTEKLARRFSGTVATAEALQEAIEEERATLAALAQQGQIVGHGMPRVETGMSDYDMVQAAIDGLFDIHESEGARSVPRLAGIREAFQVATGVDIATVGGVDRPVREAVAVGLRHKAQQAREKGGWALTESEIMLREADVTTATFSYLLGTSMNVRLSGRAPSTPCVPATWHLYPV